MEFERQDHLTEDEQAIYEAITRKLIEGSAQEPLSLFALETAYAARIGNIEPDLIVMSPVWFEEFKSILLPQQRFKKDKGYKWDHAIVMSATDVFPAIEKSYVNVMRYPPK